MRNPDIDRLKELLSYDPCTGELSWRVQRGKCRAGTVITCRNGAGYIVARVDNVLLRAHRIAWAVTNGEWPIHEIDHINGDPSDNRIENLRQANRIQNMHNIKMPVTNKSGLKGVSWHSAANKWQAHIRSDGKNYYLGLFDSKDAAHLAYVEASKKLHGVFGRH